MMHASPDRTLGPSPTFFVDAERQKKNLAEFHRKEQQLAEAYHKNRPLAFNARAFQRTHPAKAANGHKDADVTLPAPLILGVADGVSQIEDYGIDPSELPKEILKECEHFAARQLVPDADNEDTYRGPIPLLRRAFEATKSLGSLTVVLAIMDNSTRIHGKRHPMIAIVTVGDCELLILRRLQGRTSRLESICHTEMQRIDGHAQTPLQLARVDGRIDENFHDGITIEVIEKGSAVHCVSAYEGDIIIMGSDGVFDNLFLDEITAMSNALLPPSGPAPMNEMHLQRLAEEIVRACHAKTQPGPNGMYPEAPIGRGGKKDDTSVVVAEVVQWAEVHAKQYAKVPKKGGGKSGAMPSWTSLFTRMDGCCAALGYESDAEEEVSPPPPKGRKQRDRGGGGGGGENGSGAYEYPHADAQPPALGPVGAPPPAATPPLPPPPAPMAASPGRPGMLPPSGGAAPSAAMACGMAAAPWGREGFPPSSFQGGARPAMVGAAGYGGCSGQYGPPPHAYGSPANIPPPPGAVYPGAAPSAGSAVFSPVPVLGAPTRPVAGPAPVRPPWPAPRPAGARWQP